MKILMNIDQLENFSLMLQHSMNKHIYIYINSELKSINFHSQIKKEN